MRRIQIFTAAFIVILVQGSSVAAQFPSQPKIQFIPPPPPTIGAPQGDEWGAGSRGPACKRYENITALVPLTTTSTQPIRWGLTTAEHPTVWLYAPQGLAANIPLELVLQDEAGKNRSKTVFQASAVPKGIFSLSLPVTVAPLQFGKPYHWSVFISCDPEAIDIPIVVRGGLQRVALSSRLRKQLATTHNLKQANFYAKSGIWYDALTTLGERLRQGKDVEAIAVWKNLLQQAGFAEIAASPIVHCCKVVNHSAKMH